MSGSSTARNNFELPRSSNDLSHAPEQENPEAVTPGKVVDFPDFTRYGGAATYAITARLAGRMNASSVSSSEHKGLLREREKLLKKKFDVELSPFESRRLDYVRWSLDRIEDAKHGQVLDELEAQVESYERFGSDLQRLLDGLKAHVKK